MKLLLLSFLIASPSFAAGSALKVQIEGIRNAKGSVLVALHNSPTGFAQDASKAVRGAKVKAQAGSVLVSFDNLEPGTYAVAYMLDENDNGKLDTGTFGIPTEGFGFSRDPHVMFSSPSFDAASFPIQGPLTTIRTKAQYF